MMIKNIRLLRELEDTIAKKEGRLSFSYSIGVFESLWNEGIKLGVLPLHDPMEGIEVDIKVARILNSCLRKPFQK